MATKGGILNSLFLFSKKIYYFLNYFNISLLQFWKNRKEAAILAIKNAFVS